MSWNDIRTAFFIAYKTIIKSQKSTIFLLVFILSLAFFNLIFITGFLAGFADGILNSMINTTTAHISITPQETPIQKAFILNQQSLRKDIETIPGIDATTGRYLLSGSVAYDKSKNGIFKYVSAPIIGIDPIDEKNVLKIQNLMVAGSFPNDLQEDEIILGANLAGGFDTVQASDLGGAKVGDKVQVTYPSGIIRTYTVRGVFNITIGFFGTGAFISKKEAETILSTNDAASEILVKVDLNKNTLKEYVTHIKEIAPTLKVEDYTRRLSAVGILVTAFNSMSFIVSMISIAVAAITLFVMIYINAVSKRRQIGILKAIGIRESIIELSYVLQSLFYGVLGVMGGLVLLFLVVRPYLGIHPIIMPFGNAKLIYTPLGILIDIFCLIFAAFVAGLIPARIVTRQGILKAIWG